MCRAGCCGGADVAEVAGHQGKDAGGEERYQPGEHGDRDGDEVVDARPDEVVADAAHRGASQLEAIVARHPVFHGKLARWLR